MVTEIKKERALWLDYLRVAAACAVVLMHTLTGNVDIMNTAAYQDGRLMLAVMDLVTWCVPVFLMISGYLFLNPDKEITFIQMLTKYCLRIVLALLVFGIPFSCIELLIVERSFRVEMLWEAFLMVLTMKSWSHMWYLYLILFLYVLTPWMKKALAKTPAAILGVLMAVLVVGSSVMPFGNKVLQTYMLPTLPDGMIYLFYYLMGYVLHMVRRNPSVSASERRMGRWSGVIVAALVAVMVLSRVAGGFHIQMAYNYPPTVLLSVAMMAWACYSQMKKTKLDSVIAGFARISFTAYLIHPVFLNVFYKVLNVSLMEHSLIIALLVLWLVTLALTIISAALLHKVKPLKKYVL